MLDRVSVDSRPDGIQRGGVAELHRIGVGAGPHVVVRIDEPREHRAAARVELLGTPTERVADLPILADGRDPTVFHAHRLGGQPPFVHGPHLRVADHQLHRARS